jgi:para-aminobenzoate synthetase
VNGVPPVVIPNDDPDFTLDHLQDYDNVVISPGPGRPDRSEDFGICADVIRSGRLPLLGVCLGHQGLCHLSGGKVDRAPEARHARLSPVIHVQDDLFAGLPSPVHVVRYHSLIVARLPDELEATAWTPDGVLMGVRHRTRPAWGVQFHPESICTEYGTELLHNYAKLTQRWRRRKGGRTNRWLRPPHPKRPTAEAGGRV